MNSQNGSRALIGRRYSRTFNKERGRKDKCKKGGLSPPSVTGGRGGAEREACVHNYRALLSKNKNRKKLLSPRSRQGLHPPRNVNANLVKILVSLPQLRSGGRGSRGRRGKPEPRYLDCNSSWSLLAAPHGSQRPNTQSHTHPKTQPFPLSPHAPTSGFGSLETVLEAPGARRGGRGSEGSPSRGR